MQLNDPYIIAARQSSVGAICTQHPVPEVTHLSWNMMGLSVKSNKVWIKLKLILEYNGVIGRI